MILTVTLNPSVDISYPLETLKIDTVNRVKDVSKTAGGKGLNVTRVLYESGDKVTATGFLGGKIGEFIESELEQSPVSPAVEKISGNTRNCIAILHEGNHTEILEQGPTISHEEAEGFLDHYSNLIKQSEVVTISGSLPSGLPNDYYEKLIQLASDEGVAVVLDCSGAPLETVLKSSAKPTAIKPNNEELSQLLGKEVTKDIEELKDVLKESLFSGIEWIVVSLGRNGAFAKHGDVFYKVDIPDIPVVNPVGSGDSTVAGIASALNSKKSDADLLKHAMTLGMLNAQETMTGHVNMTNYETLNSQIGVKEV